MRLQFLSFYILFCIINLSLGFDNDTVITIEPRFFFKELISIWSIYLFKSHPVKVVNLDNNSDANNSKILKNLSVLDSAEDFNRNYPCIFHSINYWNYKSGKVRIPIVLHIDHPVEKENAKSSANNTSTVNKMEAKKCAFIFIYARWCKFSMAAAPIFNALGRIFPQLEFIALPITDYQEFKWNLHTSYVPRIKFYFGSRSVREFNGTDNNLEELVDFVFSVTGQLPYLTPRITDRDYVEPISSNIEPSTTVWLIISWILTILCSVYLVCATGYGRHKFHQLYQFLSGTELFQT